MRVTLSTLIVALASASAAVASHGPSSRSAKRGSHGGMLRRLVNVTTEEPLEHRAYVGEGQDLQKRGPTYSGRATYFAVGLGACGIYSKSSEFVVALNVAQYGGNNGQISPWCFQSIDIHYGGQTRTARVVDLCPGCGYGGLDMSESLFSSFASTSLGVFQMTWNRHGDSPQPTTTTTRARPTSTTSTRRTTSTTSSSSTSSSSSSTSSTEAATTAAPTSTPPVQATPVGEPVANFEGIKGIVEGLYALANAGQAAV